MILLRKSRFLISVGLRFQAEVQKVPAAWSIYSIPSGLILSLIQDRENDVTQSLYDIIVGKL